MELFPVWKSRFKWWKPFHSTISENYVFLKFWLTAGCGECRLQNVGHHSESDNSGRIAYRKELYHNRQEETNEKQSRDLVPWNHYSHSHLSKLFVLPLSATSWPFPLQLEASHGLQLPGRTLALLPTLCSSKLMHPPPNYQVHVLKYSSSPLHIKINVNYWEIKQVIINMLDNKEKSLDVKHSLLHHLIFRTSFYRRENERSSQVTDSRKHAVKELGLKFRSSTQNISTFVLQCCHRIPLAKGVVLRLTCHELCWAPDVISSWSTIPKTDRVPAPFYSKEIKAQRDLSNLLCQSIFQKKSSPTVNICFSTWLIQQ